MIIALVYMVDVCMNDLKTLNVDNEICDDCMNK